MRNPDFGRSGADLRMQRVYDIGIEARAECQPDQEIAFGRLGDRDRHESGAIYPGAQVCDCLEVRPVVGDIDRECFQIVGMFDRNRLVLDDRRAGVPATFEGLVVTRIGLVRTTGRSFKGPDQPSGEYHIGEV